MSEPEQTKTRSLVADPGGARVALPLARKIALAMAGVTLLTSALVFFSAQTKSADLLDREIDARGARLVQTLASIEPSYWLESMKGGRTAWRDRAAALLGSDSGLLQMSVLDVAEGDTIRASVQIVDRRLTLEFASPRAAVGRVEVSDGTLFEEGVTGGVPARRFRFDVPHEQGRLRFYVVLSIAHISAAQRG